MGSKSNPTVALTSLQLGPNDSKECRALPGAPFAFSRHHTATNRTTSGLSRYGSGS
jgi:hypothetical protein